MSDPAWDSASFGLPPVAGRTGPFPGRAFLETWWSTAAPAEDRLIIADDSRGLVAARLHRGALDLVGHEDVTDYHSPLGEITAGLIDELADGVPAGTPFRFDSLPAEAADVMAKALVHRAGEVHHTQHEVAAVLDLPPTFDAYLAAIGKKERHETRRKRRRFGDAIGEPRLVRVAGADQVHMFANMHRLSTGEKATFMSTQMEELFLALHQRCGAVIDVLVGDAGAPVAAAFGFEDADGYYLYNSAYDPAAGHASPGVVLVSMLIESTIESGRHVFDFLKGDEAYKFRLGAEPRPLYALEGTLGAAK